MVRGEYITAFLPAFSEDDFFVGFAHWEEGEVGGKRDEEDTPLRPAPGFVLGCEAAYYGSIIC